MIRYKTQPKYCNECGSSLTAQEVKKYNIFTAEEEPVTYLMCDERYIMHSTFLLVLMPSPEDNYWIKLR